MTCIANDETYVMLLRKVDTEGYVGCAGYVDFERFIRFLEQQEDVQDIGEPAYCTYVPITH